MTPRWIYTGLVLIGCVLGLAAPSLLPASLRDSIDSLSLSRELTVVMAVTLCITLLSLALYRLKLRVDLKVRQLNESDLKLKTLSSALTYSGSSIVITDAQGIIEYVNLKFTQVTGYDAHEIQGQHLSRLKVSALSARTQKPAPVRFHPLHGSPQDNWSGELLVGGKNGQEFWSAITISSIKDDQGQVRNYIISGVDISELKEAHRKMEQLALYDSLTGLANRRLFMDRLQQALAGCQRSQTSAALLFLDLDQFKRINDSLGHDAGDMLLLVVAERLKANVRAKDTVARLGGDEFTVLLTDIPDTYAVTHVAQQILTALKQPIRLHKHEIIISTSIGITLAPGDSNSVESLMKNADLALYKAKEFGRDRYHFFTEELNAQALRHLIMEQELRQALSGNEFCLDFQPQVDLHSEQIISVEALLRWNHPTRGRVNPDEFIKVAEETGLIIPLGRWVLRNACMQIRMIQQLTGYDIRVAVNLSARQFRDPHLEETVSEVLAESGLSPHCLELEVTESMLMDDIDKVIEQLNRIKSTGVTVAIDDFGSGYSSLSYLKRLPVDILKVDRKFVQDIPNDINDMEITSAVIAVAHKLSLKVVAEGVEDIDQRDFLMINRCDYAQGFYFSKPLGFEELYSHMQTKQIQATG